MPFYTFCFQKRLLTANIHVYKLLHHIFYPFVFHVCLSEDNILKKFRQNDYCVDIYRSMKTYWNKKLLRKIDIVTFKYNRTVTAFNVSMITTVDTNREIKISSQVYKFLSNEYRKFPVQVNVTLCDVYASNVGGLGNLRNYGNIESCEFKKDVLYQFHNFVPDPFFLPPFFPNGEFKITAQYSFKNELALIVELLIKVYRPIKY